MRISSERAVLAGVQEPEQGPTVSKPGSGASESSFARALSSVGTRLDGGEALMERALSTDLGNLGPSELIAVQAGIYRYVEAVDFAAKLVDRASNSIKTVLQGSH